MVPKPYTLKPKYRAWGFCPVRLPQLRGFSRVGWPKGYVVSKHKQGHFELGFEGQDATAREGLESLAVDGCRGLEYAQG